MEKFESKHTFRFSTSLGEDQYYQSEVKSRENVVQLVSHSSSIFDELFIGRVLRSWIREKVTQIRGNKRLMSREFYNWRHP